jgi:hypothetical protein
MQRDLHTRKKNIYILHIAPCWSSLWCSKFTDRYHSCITYLYSSI